MFDSIRGWKMSLWKKLSSKTLFQTGFFRLRVDECQLPDGRIQPQYYVMEFADWVNVVPITKDGQILMLRQFRYGAGEEFWEIPGGSTHPGSAEAPRLAAERELLEETGHQASEWIDCGFHYPNPSLQNNRMHTFVALGCEKISAQQLDPYEVLQVVPMPIAQAVKLWEDGSITHSLIEASFGRALKVLRQRGLVR